MSTIAMHGMQPLTRTASEPGALRAAAPTKRLRMTARGRAVLLALLAAPLVGGIVAGAMNGGAADATRDALTPLEYVVVEPGDTLWALAAEIAPGADPRDVIRDIEQFNRLDSADLLAGMSLAIPPKYER